MKIKLGDFFPRVTYGWPTSPTVRCHKMGAHVVEIQGGLGVAEVAARNGDAEGVKDGLRRIEAAAQQLAGGLPEGKEIAGKLKRRAHDLIPLAEPYRYKEKLPKKAADAIRDQLTSMGGYELVLEGMSIKACGGHLMHVHTNAQADLQPLPKLPAALLEEARRKKARQDAENQKRLQRKHQQFLKRLERKRAQGKGRVR